MTFALWSKSDGYEVGTLADLDGILRTRHYLGPCPPNGVRLVIVQWRSGEVVAGQVWRLPAARFLPNDGSWLELSRWVLTPEAGPFAGSRMHRWVAKWLRVNRPEVTTLVSYSDPSQGHTGALYRACNWLWRPTWIRLRPPPSGNGTWDGVTTQSVKDRWIFPLRRDDRRDGIVQVTDAAAWRAWESVARPSSP